MFPRTIETTPTFHKKPYKEQNHLYHYRIYFWVFILQLKFVGGDLMATNEPTIKALLGFSGMIDGLNTKPSQDLIDEIKAWNRLLKYHLKEQKKQDGKWKKHEYKYDEKIKKVLRLTSHGRIIARI